MQSRATLPDIERLSIVTATIMLAFALTQLVSFPEQVYLLPVLGILLIFFLISAPQSLFFTVLLAAAGMDWLIQSHPEKTVI
jgi:hypothetical protein